MFPNKGKSPVSKLVGGVTQRSSHEQDRSSEAEGTRGHLVEVK